MVFTPEFRKLVSKCDFLFDWQKKKLLRMLDEVGEVDDGDGDDKLGGIAGNLEGVVDGSSGHGAGEPLPVIFEGG